MENDAISHQTDGDLPPSQIPASAPMQRARGQGRIVTQLREGSGRIGELFQEGCARIRLPKTASTGLEAVLINTAGGLTGGDRLDWRAEATAGTRLVLTTPACERVYRSSGGDAEINTRLVLGKNAHIDWLPQETILFEHARLNRRLEIEMAEGATLTALEAVLLGRQAMGEAARSALLHDVWRVTRHGRLIHAEANRLSGTDRERDADSLLAGNMAFATILHVAENAQARLDTIRALLPNEANAAASAMGERLIIRVLAPTGLALRRLIAPILAELSTDGALPRLWST